MPEDHTQEGEGDKKSLYSERTVAGEYERNKSVQAKARVQKSQKKNLSLQGVVSKTDNDHYLEQTSLTKELGATEAAKQTIKNVAQRLILKRISPWLYSISFTICFWQFVFAILSLSGFVIHTFSLTVAEVTDQSLKSWWVTAPTYYFVNWYTNGQGFLTALLPGQYIGYGFWALALIVGIGGFIGFIIFFHLLGIKLMRSVVATLIFFVCMAFTILPPTNIFPWLTLWIWYVIHSETSHFSMSLHRPTAHQPSV